jgi:peptidyl-prolyl cis-trans isomerase SurA
MLHKIVLSIAFCLSAFTVSAQQKQNLDKIIVVIGDHIALQSEVNQVAKEYEQSGIEITDSVRCSIVESILTKYLLCEQAALDSVSVSDEEVEANLNNRLRYMENAYGGLEQMEAVLGKSSFLIKEEYRRFLKDIMISQRIQGQLQQGVKISPAEVRAFYEKIPKDSLPTYPSMVECGQIVISPVASKEAEDYVKQQLADIKKQILEGKAEFETMASIYSSDPGTKNVGGNLGVVSRDEMVPEFSAAGFRLQNNEISDPVKTKYGYHIIQMMQRMGEKAKLRHILIKPTITSGDITACQAKLDSIRTLITSGKFTFNEAVGKFTDDDVTKNTGGMVVNPQSGSSLLTMDELGAELAIAVGNMKVGDYSTVQTYDAAENQPVTTATSKENLQCRILFLKSITEPHVADLNKDFNRIQQVALDDKKNKYIFNWVENKTTDFYIKIDPEYATCPILNKWQQQKKNN